MNKTDCKWFEWKILKDKSSYGTIDVSYDRFPSCAHPEKQHLGWSCKECEFYEKKN